MGFESNFWLFGLQFFFSLGEGSYGEVVKAVMTDSARSQYPNYESYDFAVKRVLISFINREQAIKERTGRDVVQQVMLERNLLSKANRGQSSIF